MPVLFLLPVCALYGLLVGSFNNVVIWRVPRRASVVRPKSACPNCGMLIPARCNIPLLSWVALRGRSRCCATPISWRYPAVEVATAALWVLLAWRFGWSPELPVVLLFGSAAVCVTVIDLGHYRIPNTLNLALTTAAAATIAVVSLATDHPGRLFGALAAGAVTAAGFLVLHLIYPKGMGLGDVKFLFPLAMVVVFAAGAGALAVALFAAFVSGAVGGVAAIARRRDGNHQIPFGPFLVAGALVGLFAGPHLWSLYLELMY